MTRSTPIVWWALVFLWAGLVSAQQMYRGVPLATPDETKRAQLFVSEDGREVTFRGPALDDLRVCAEPREGVFGLKRCYTLRDLRRGEVAK